MKKYIFKILIIIFSITFIFVLKEQISFKKLNKTKDNKIFENCKSIEQALEIYNNYRTTDYDNLIRQGLEDFIIKKISGNYYFRSENISGVSTYMKNKFPDKYKNEADDRTIYVKNKEEIYITPFSEEYLKEKNIKLADLATIENNHLYKYKLESIKLNNDEIIINFSSYYIEEKYGSLADDHYKTIQFKIYLDEEKYLIDGFCSDMITINDDITNEKYTLKSGLSKTRTYYSSLKRAEEIRDKNIEKRNQDAAERNKIKNSKPTIGMTASEVRQSKWGYPDRINKDTYSWGTHEQWVYDHYGYVYLENGIVRSVSER